MGAGVPDYDQPAVIADKMRQILISQNPWETLENCRLVRVIDMLLQLITALFRAIPASMCRELQERRDNGVVSEHGRGSPPSWRVLCP